MFCCGYFVAVVPHPRCGVVRCSTQLFSSPGTLLFARSKAVYSSLIPGVPPNPILPTSPGVFLECPSPASPCRLAECPICLPGVPNLRVCSECPAPECPWSAQPGCSKSNICACFFACFGCGGAWGACEDQSPNQKLVRAVVEHSRFPVSESAVLVSDSVVCRFSNQPF